MKIVKTMLAAFMLTGILAVSGLSATPLQPAPAGEKGAFILKPLEKLGRGVANVVLSPAEIFIQMHDVTQRSGNIPGFFYGTLRGLAFCIARIGVGVVDIVTFPFPLPDCPETPDGFGAGYGPIMYPAWVIDVEHDWWNFAFDQNSIPSRTY